MKTHTSQFKEDIKTVGKQLDSKIIFKVDGVTQTLTSEDLNGVTPTFQGAILKSVMKELDIDSNVNIPIGTEVNYQFGVKLENNFEYLDYGNYIVYSSEKQEDTSSYKIICYDKMLYSMKQNEDLGITYPISIRNYINALCTKIGLEFKNKNDEFANFDRVLDKELYVGLDYTYRDILDELAQVTASTICLDNEDKVEIRYINDLTELNEVVGTNININDSIDYKLNFLTLYGRSTQATRSGYNLVKNGNKFKGACGCATGITGSLTNEGYQQFDVETGNSNWTTGWFYSINQEIEENLSEGDTFTIMFTMRRTEGISVPPKIYIKNGMGYYSMIGTLSTEFSVVYYTGTWKDTNGIGPHLGFGGLTGTFIIKNWMIKKGGLEEWEDYGVMPSPDFPSPIESVGRRNIIKSLSRKWSDGINYNLDNSLIKKTMTFSCIIDTSITSANLYIIPATGVSAISLGTINFTANQRVAKTFDLTDEQIQVIKSNQGGIFQIYKSSAFESANITDAQLEKGTVATDYVPYEHTEISATVAGKNIFNKNNLAKSRGVNKSIINTGVRATITVAGKYKYCAMELGAKNLLDKTITLNATITPSASNIGQIGVYFGNQTSYSKKVINTKSQSGKANIKIPNSFPEDCDRIWILFYGNTNGVGNVGDYVDYSDLMIVVDDTIDNYEEYKSNSLTIDLQGNELCSLPNGTKDEVNITNGEALLIKKSKKIKIDVSQIGTTSNYQNITYATIPKPQDFKGYGNYNSNFVMCTNASIYKSLFRTWDTANNINFIYSSAQLTKWWIGFQKDTTLEQMKSSLANAEILYELAEPETINLGTVEMPHTYDDVSYITNSADTEMVVKYSKGWETINEEYLKDINVNFGQKYGPVNSVVLTRGAESDNIYLQDENSIAQNGLCEIKIADNQIMNWNDRSDYLPDILEKLDGLEYYLNDFSSTGIAYLDLCDRYNIEVFENTYSCVMFNDELLVTQGLEENVHTDMPEETETDYTKADKTDRKINNVSLIVDKQEQKINALAEKIQDISNTISGTGVITLTECNQTPLYKLVITGDDSLLFSNSKLFPSATTYLKSSTLYVNKGTDYETIYDLKIPALRTLGSVKDEYIMENGKAKLIKRIGLNNNLQKYVLDTPIETDLGEMIINLKEGENTLEMPSFPTFRHTATYLLQNEYTDVFASQAQVTSQINIANDEVLIESKSQILGNGDELIASINTTSTGNVKIKASDTIALEGTTTVGDKIMFNLDGSITAQDLRLLDGGKVIGGDGLLTSMQFESVGQYNGFQFLGFNYNANNEVYKTSVSTTFNIPENFVVVSAYATLLHTPINFWDFNNTSITGSAKNLKLYKDFSANVDKIYAGFNSGYWIENNNLNGDEITNAFGSATYTPANSQSGALVSKTSIDIKDYISTGLNTLFVRTTDSTSSTSSNSTDACKKTGCAKLIIQVIGYTNFK